MAIAETETEAGDRPARPRGRRRRRLLRGGWRIAVLSLVSVVAFGVAVVGLVALLLMRGPLTLPDWVAGRIESRVNGGLAVGRVSLDRVVVEMGPGGAPQVKLRNVGIFDDRGTEVARLNEVGAAFDPAALIRGHVLPQALALSGAQITIRRLSDGSIDLRFGDSSGGASGSLAGVLDGIDRIFSQGPLARVGKIGASELTITLEDARAERLWQVTDGRLLLSQDEDSVAITVNFDVFNGTEELASTALTFRSEKGSPAARIGARIRNAASGDIALQSPVLAFLEVLEAPISGSMDLAIGGDGRLTAFDGSLEIGQGSLTPAPGGEPLQIDRGRAYFSYDPEDRRIDFSDLSVESDAAAVRLSGQTFLEDLRPDGWPNSFVGQFRLEDLTARDPAWLNAPLVFADGSAQLKLTMQPFRLTVGALTLHHEGATIRASGSARAGAAGPDLAFDLGIDRISSDRLLALWPERVLPKTRIWLAENVLGGDLVDAKLGLRRPAGEAERLLLGFGIEDATVRFMPTMPPIERGQGYATLDRDRLTVVVREGQVPAPEGGVVNVAGSVMVIPDVNLRPQPAEVRLRTDGPITATLSLLDQPPLNVMERAGRPVGLAEGRAEMEAIIALTLKDRIDIKDISYDVAGRLLDVSSDKLVQGREFATPTLALTASPEGVEISGVARMGNLPMDIRWRQGIGPDAEGISRVDGTMEISAAFLEEFGIDLPAGSVRGTGTGEITLEMREGAAPKFRLTSDLRGIALKIDSIAWIKSANAKGRLEVTGTLGETPAIDRVEIEGGGLNASGTIALKADGSLAEARFARVRLGGWLDAPVVLVGRGRGVQPAVKVNGGTLDFRKANFGDAGGKGGGPVTAALDRLYIAEGITLTRFRGDFTTVGGFGGTFTARLNDGGEIRGTVQPQNGGTALRVTSQNAGDVLKDANLAQRVRGGAMELVLLPAGQTGIYNGTLTAQRVRVRGTPALAALLGAISVVGLVQQLNGDGIVFDQVQASFTLTPNAVNFRRSSATGASLGISVEGLYELGTGRLNLQGVFSPVYLVNGIGAVLTRKGEGLFGFNYKVTGTSEAPKVKVNPLSILTPGMFREIFRAPPPKIR